MAPIANEVIGHVEGGGDVSKTQNVAGESPLGDLIADSQLADDSTIPPSGEKPMAAFMNPGGIRADLITNVPDDPSAITYGAAFTVQPFNNFLVSMTLGEALRHLQDLVRRLVGAGELLLEQRVDLLPVKQHAGPAALRGRPGLVAVQRRAGSAESLTGSSAAANR